MNEFKKEFITFCRRVVSLHVIVYFLAGIFALLCLNYEELFSNETTSSAMLSLFLREELIDQARVNMLKDWKHSGFSIESETRLFSKADREALGQYVVRGATCAERIQYDQDSDTVIWTASPKGFYKGKSETFKGFEFVDQLAAHLPPRRVQLVRRYGVYAGKAAGTGAASGRLCSFTS